MVNIVIHPSEHIGFQQFIANELPLSPPISEKECRVFFADIHDFNTIELLHAGLSEEEQQKASRYSHPTSAQLYVLGKYLTRKVIAQQLGLAPLDLSFQQTKTGKPYLDSSFGGIKFNLSHSGTKVLLAISAAEVGVDIELIKSIKNIDGIIASCFTIEESLAFQESLEPLPNFYSQWTVKEAIGKCLGQGIGLDLKTLPSLVGRYSLPLNHPGIKEMEVFPYTIEKYVLSIGTSIEAPQLSFFEYR